MDNNAAHPDRREPEPGLEHAASKLKRDMDQLKQLYAFERSRLEERSFRPQGED